MKVVSIKCEGARKMPTGPGITRIKTRNRKPNFVYRFDELIDVPEDYERIQIALFGRYDLSVKTMMYKHIHEMTEQLREEVHRQSVRAVQLFDEMVNAGLHQQLGDIG